MEYLQYLKRRGWMEDYFIVLNLVINGIPSILLYTNGENQRKFQVLNLVINGIPSIQKSR